MLGRSIVCSLGLHESGFGGVKIASGDSAFGKELFARVHDALIEFQIRFCLLHVKLRLLVLFGHLRLGCGGVCTLCGRVCAPTVQGGRREVPIFECREKLSSLDVRAALYVEVPNRRSDFGRDGGLRDGSEYGIRWYEFGNGAELR